MSVQRGLNQMTNAKQSLMSYLQTPDADLKIGAGVSLVLELILTLDLTLDEACRLRRRDLTLNNQGQMTLKGQTLDVDLGLRLQMTMIQSNRQRDRLLKGQRLDPTEALFETNADPESFKRGLRRALAKASKLAGFNKPIRFRSA